MDVTFYEDKPFFSKTENQGERRHNEFQFWNNEFQFWKFRDTSTLEKEPGCPTELEATTACLVNETVKPETTIAETTEPETTTTHPTNKKPTAQVDKPFLVYSRRQKTQQDQEPSTLLRQD